MKTLKLNDGTLLEVTDDSTISNLSFPFATYAHIDSVVDALTVENLTHVELDDDVFVYLTVVSMFVDTVTRKLVVVTRTQTNEETVDAQIKELQDSIIEILEIIGGME